MPPSPAYKRNVSRLAPEEVRGAEEPQRHHGRLQTLFDDEERDQGQAAGHRCDGGGFNGRVGNAAQRNRRQ